MGGLLVRFCPPLFCPHLWRSLSLAKDKNTLFIISLFSWVIILLSFLHLPPSSCLSSLHFPHLFYCFSDCGLHGRLCLFCSSAACHSHLFLSILPLLVFPSVLFLVLFQRYHVSLARLIIWYAVHMLSTIFSERHRKNTPSQSLSLLDRNKKSQRILPSVEILFRESWAARVLLPLPIGFRNGSEMTSIGFPNRSSNRTQRRPKAVPEYCWLSRLASRIAWNYSTSVVPIALQTVLGDDLSKESLAIVRKSVMSIESPPAILGPEMAVPILWAPGIFRFFLLETPHARKIPCFRGGDRGFFGRGGVEVRKRQFVHKMFVHNFCVP